MASRQNRLLRMNVGPHKQTTLCAGLCDVLALFVVLCVHRPNLRLGMLR